MKLWRIYYGDGSTADDSTPVAVVPCLDVQAILWLDESNGKWKTLSGYGRYVWKLGRWWGMHQDDIPIYLSEPGWKKVLFGDWMKKPDFQELMKRVLADREWLMKAE